MSPGEKKTNGFDEVFGIAQADGGQIDDLNDDVAGLKTAIGGESLHGGRGMDTVGRLKELAGRKIDSHETAGVERIGEVFLSRQKNLGDDLAKGGDLAGE